MWNWIDFCQKKLETAKDKDKEGRMLSNYFCLNALLAALYHDQVKQILLVSPLFMLQKYDCPCCKFWLSMLQKYVQIAVCAIDRKQRRKSMGGVFVGLPIINISWSTNRIHVQI